MTDNEIVFYASVWKHMHKKKGGRESFSYAMTIPYRVAEIYDIGARDYFLVKLTLLKKGTLLKPQPKKEEMAATVETETEKPKPIIEPKCRKCGHAKWRHYVEGMDAGNCVDCSCTDCEEEDFE